MTPMCLLCLICAIYLLLIAWYIIVTLKKINIDKLIIWLMIITGTLSLIGSLICFYIYQSSEYLAVLFALFFVYIFFSNLFKQNKNYESFSKNFFKNSFCIFIELSILVFLTNVFEKKIGFIKNVIIGEVIFPIGICIILYIYYSFVDFTRKYDEKFLYCKMITLITFYINIIAILFLVQVKIDSLNTVISSILVVLSLLMNFIDKAEQFNYYFRTDGKIKDIKK